MSTSALLRLIGLAAIWGASFLFMRVAAPVLGAVPTAFFRVSLAGLGLFALLLVLGVKLDFRGKFKQVLVLGLINSGVPALMYTLAALVLPAGYSAIFNATTPLMATAALPRIRRARSTASKGNKRCATSGASVSYTCAVSQGRALMPPTNSSAMDR